MSEQSPLTSFVGLVADALIAEDRWWGPHRLLFIAPVDDDAFDLGFKEIDDHPANHLLGFVAPDDWVAFGIVSLGWGAPLETEGGTWIDHEPVRPSMHPKRRRTRQVSIVQRDGGRADRFRQQGQPTVVSEAPGGLIPDLLLRAIGAPTPACPVRVAGWVLAWWVTRIAMLGRPGGRLLSAADVDALRPVPDLVRSSWADVRWRIVTGDLVVPECDAELAAWFDDGAFARWLLGSLPEPRAVIRTAERNLSRSGKRRLQEAMDTIGRSMPGEEPGRATAG